MDDNRVFLLPGESHVTRSSRAIATLLGSCVGVTLWHRAKGHAAMNHYLLDQAPPNTPPEAKGRYGDTSTSGIIRLMRRLDRDMGALDAGVYGGAVVIAGLQSLNADRIGERNILIAREELGRAGIRIVQEDVGGDRGRRIYFNPATGAVKVRYCQRSDLAEKRADRVSRDIRVLVVDDSETVRRILSSAIDGARGMTVCGQAQDAYEARELVLSAKPDVISLDIIMPRMDGLKFLQKMMGFHPIPVVICSTIAKDDSDIARRAMAYGAMDAIDKESLAIHHGLDAVRERLIPALRNASTRVARKKTFT